MTDMIEVVARALDPNAWGDRAGGAKEAGFERTNDAGRRRRSLVQAKAAIEALHEPTDEMLDRGSRARVATCHKMPSALALKEYAAPEIMQEDRLGMREAWQAGIDAALEGKDD